jgi:hypothetical protein
MLMARCTVRLLFGLNSYGRQIPKPGYKMCPNFRNAEVRCGVCERRCSMHVTFLITTAPASGRGLGHAHTKLVRCAARLGEHHVAFCRSEVPFNIISDNDFALLRRTRAKTVALHCPPIVLLLYIVKRQRICKLVATV